MTDGQRAVYPTGPCGRPTGQSGGPGGPHEPPPAPRGRPTGLRERKKRRTRDALLHAALGLFTTQGYEETTVDEIVDAVEVSQRTFFRYFASKEEAAFAIQEMVESHFLSELRLRPASRPCSRRCAARSSAPGTPSVRRSRRSSRSNSTCVRTR